MAASTIEIKSAGLTVSFSGFTAKILNLTGPKFMREFLDTTHQGTTTLKTNVPAPFAEADDVSITYRTNDTDAYATLIEGAQGTLTITYPTAVGRATAKSWSVTAGIKEIGDSQSLGQLVEGTIVWKTSGDWTETAGS